MSGSFLPGLGWLAPPKSTRVWEPTLLWNQLRSLTEGFACATMKRHAKGISGLGRDSGDSCTSAVILFFPSEWEPAFVALLFLVIFGGFYFGYRSIYRSKSK
jgi:hypothetical protein